MSLCLMSRPWRSVGAREFCGRALRRRRRLALVQVLVLASFAVSGQAEEAEFERRHQEALAANPPDVTFELRLGGGREAFFQGEVIPVELVFSSTTPQRYELDMALYDRCGRVMTDEYHFEPEAGAVDPLRDFYAPDGQYGCGGVRHVSVLDPNPDVVEMELNEWLRFDRPGKYRLFVTTLRLRDLSVERENGGIGKWLKIASRAIDLTILAADPDWSARVLAQARADLDSADRERRERGCTALRHLGTTAAIAELVRETGGRSNGCGQAILGLFGHPERSAVIDAMEAKLTAPDEAVDARFIRRLAKLAWFGDHPLPAESESLSREDAQAWRAEVSRGIEERVSAYAERLAASIGDKRGAARPGSLWTLLDTAQQSNASPRRSAELEALRPRLARHFRELPPEKQADLLRRSWGLLRHPSFRSVLLGLYEDPPEMPRGGAGKLRDLAVRRLQDLDPGAARQILLSEMRRPDPRLGAGVIALFPDATLPAEVEASVIGHLRQIEPGVGGWKDLLAIVGRFGSVAIRDEVESIYERESDRDLKSCWRAPFLAYFLRVDPRGGNEKLRTEVLGPETGAEGVGGRSRECARRYLAEVAAFGPSPALDLAAVELLDSGDPKLETAAIEMLGKHGTATAQAPLWRRYERWHQTWQRRAEELRFDGITGRRQNDEAVQFERALHTALAEGAGWVIDRSAAERLERLAVSDQVKQQAESLARRIGDEIRLRLWSLEQPHFDVAQYDLQSLDALKARLSLFPEGTVFHWHCADRKADPAAVEALFVELEGWLAEQGKGLAR